MPDHKDRHAQCSGTCRLNTDHPVTSHGRECPVWTIGLQPDCGGAEWKPTAGRRFGVASSQATRVRQATTAHSASAALVDGRSAAHCAQSHRTEWVKALRRAARDRVIAVRGVRWLLDTLRPLARYSIHHLAGHLSPLPVQTSVFAHSRSAMEPSPPPSSTASLSAQPSTASAADTTSPRQAPPRPAGRARSGTSSMVPSTHDATTGTTTSSPRRCSVRILRLRR